MWDFSVIKDILMNPVYTGAIASQKTDYRFKIGTIREKKPEDWIVVEGQHEPLVDKKSFDIVQEQAKIPPASEEHRGNQPVCRAYQMRRVREVPDRPYDKRQAPEADLLLQDLQCLWEEPLQPAPDRPMTRFPPLSSTKSGSAPDAALVDGEAVADRL